MRLLAALLLASASVVACAPRAVRHVDGTCFANQCARYNVFFALQANDVPDLYVWTESRKIEHCTLAPDDDRYKRLAAWLHTHADHWAYPAAHDSRPFILVRANGFELRFMQSGTAVLVAGGVENWRRAAVSDYDYLRCHTEAITSVVLRKARYEGSTGLSEAVASLASLSLDRGVLSDSKTPH